MNNSTELPSDGSSTARQTKNLISFVTIVNIIVTSLFALGVILLSLASSQLPFIEGLIAIAAIIVSVGVYRRSDTARKIYIMITASVCILLTVFIVSSISDTSPSTSFSQAMWKGAYGILILIIPNLWNIFSIIVLTRQSVKLHFSD